MSARPRFDPGPHRPDGGRGRDVLLATGEAAPSGLAGRLAEAVARERESRLHVVSPLAVPRSLPLDSANGLVEARRDTVDEVMERADTSTSGAVRVGHDVTTTIASAASDRDVDLIVLPRTLDETVFANKLLASIAARTHCDVVAVNGAALDEGLASVLVPVAGGPHSRLAVDVSRALARTQNAWVDLLHVIPEDTESHRADARVLLDDYADRFCDVERVTTWTLDSTDVAGTIREQSRYYDLTLIGAPRTSRLRRLVFGSTAKTLRTAIRSPLAVVHRAPESEVSP